MSQRKYSHAHGLKLSDLKKWRYKLADLFPIDKNHARAKARRARLSKAHSNLRPTNKSPTANTFIPLEVDTSVQASTGHLSFKLFITDSVYLELPLTVTTTQLQNLFAAVREVK